MSKISKINAPFLLRNIRVSDLLYLKEYFQESTNAKAITNYVALSKTILKRADETSALKIENRALKMQIEKLIASSSSTS